jgi:4-hydroxybenzoate polyprenyltransferase
MGHELYAAGCFIRGSALGGTLLVAALGAFAADFRPSLAAFAGVLTVALCFHVFAYVTNDLVDLPIDRVGRPESPLVTGWIRPRAALVAGLAPVPVALAVAVAFGGPGAGALLLLGVATMAVYNLYGKRAPVPPVTDAVQGVSWAALLLAAATMTGGRWNALVWTFAAFTVVWVLMANGIHGSVRDLHVDRQFGVRSTALVYGAEPAPGGGVSFPRGLVIYAVALHAAALGLLWISVLRDDAGYSPRGRLVVVGLLLLVTVLSSHFLAVTVRSRTDGRMLRTAGMVHLVTLLAVPVVLLLPRLSPGVIAVVAALYLVPLASHSGAPDIVRWAGQSARATAGRLRRRPGAMGGA